MIGIEQIETGLTKNYDRIEQASFEIIKNQAELLPRLIKKYEKAIAFCQDNSITVGLSFELNEILQPIGDNSSRPDLMALITIFEAEINKIMDTLTSGQRTQLEEILSKI